MNKYINIYIYNSIYLYPTDVGQLEFEVLSLRIGTTRFLKRRQLCGRGMTWRTNPPIFQFYSHTYIFILA